MNIRLNTKALLCSVFVFVNTYGSSNNGEFACLDKLSNGSEVKGMVENVYDLSDDTQNNLCVLDDILLGYLDKGSILDFQENLEPLSCIVLTKNNVIVDVKCKLNELYEPFKNVLKGLGVKNIDQELLYFGIFLHTLNNNEHL